MKDEYLWDKTGENAEIEALENALKAFRFQENAPPALPAKVLTLEPPKRGRFFQLRLAFAGLTAVVIVLSVVWFQVSDNQIPPFESVAEINEPSPENRINDGALVKNPDIAPVVRIETPKPTVKPNVIKARQKSAPVFRTERAILITTEPKQPAETLTAEEKYAYDQLMLALSITGSKLKIVKDKINGIEEQNAVLDTTK